MKIETTINYTNLAKAVLVFMGEGFDVDDAKDLLQAIGYTLVDKELFPEDDELFDERELDREIANLKSAIIGNNIPPKGTAAYVPANVWRYCINDGQAGGVVFAETEKEAEARVRKRYEEWNIKDICVWPFVDDDYFSEEHPYVMDCYGW